MEMGAFLANSIRAGRLLFSNIGRIEDYCQISNVSIMYIMPTRRHPYKKIMKKTYLMLSICTLASGLLLQSSAWGYTVTADTAFTWLNSSFSATGHGTDVPSGSIVSGSSGDASSYTGSFSNAYSGWSWTAAVVQDYGIFYAQASTQAHRDFPGNDF